MRLSLPRHKHLPSLAGLLCLVEDIIWRCPGQELLQSAADAFWKLVDRAGALGTARGSVAVEDRLGTAAIRMLARKLCWAVM